MNGELGGGKIGWRAGAVSPFPIRVSITTFDGHAYLITIRGVQFLAINRLVLRSHCIDLQIIRKKEHCVCR